MMDKLKSLINAPWFRELVFIFAVILLLGGFKFGIEASVEK